jgi:hypothetical protein
MKAGIVGGDRDAHGCIPSAGYSWCASKQKCLRPWEEACPAPPAVDVSVYPTYCSLQRGMTAEYLGMSLHADANGPGIQPSEFHKVHTLFTGRALDTLYHNRDIVWPGSGHMAGSYTPQ